LSIIQITLYNYDNYCIWKKKYDDDDDNDDISQVFIMRKKT